MTTGVGEGDAWDAGPGLFQPRVEVQAWRVTRGNVARVAEWCGGHVVRDVVGDGTRGDVPAFVVVPRDVGTFADDHEELANVAAGDWVVRGVTGLFFVVADAEFRAAYQAVGVRMGVGVVDHVAEECG